MISKTQKTKLIIFLVGGTLVAVVILWLFVQPRLFESTANYYVRVPGSVSGLDKGAAVAVRGVRVGEVVDIQLSAADPEGVRLTLKVDDGVAIHRDAKASLTFQGLSGQKFIDILGGVRGTDTLPAGSYIPYQPSILDRVTDQAEGLIVEASNLLRMTNEVIGRVSEVTAHLDAERIAGLVEGAQQALDRFEGAGAELESLIKHTRAPLERTLNSADAAFRGANGVTDNASTVLSNANDLVTGLNAVVRENDAQLRAITYNLREATQSFKYLGRELRQRPSRLLISGSPPDRELP
jgi:phospholipid/cholesterol/gamma-HCH transport system substrate-binding protein